MLKLASVPMVEDLTMQEIAIYDRSERSSRRAVHKQWSRQRALSSSKAKNEAETWRRIEAAEAHARSHER